MRQMCLALIAFGVSAAFINSALSGGDVKDMLRGTWSPEKIEIDGKPAPPELIKVMRFAFKGDKVVIRGNLKDEREEECTYMIDTSVSPHSITITFPEGKKPEKPALGIFELKGDTLRLCIRHVRSSEGRPKDFSTQPGSRLMLLTLRREKK